MNAPSLPPKFIATAPHPALPDEPVLPLSVEGYHALLKTGVLRNGDPIELLEGFLVPKMAKGPRHETARRQLRRLLEKMISAEFFVDEQGAFTTQTSEPEPDVFVVRGRIEDFADRHAQPSEVVLVAEIADSSVRRDRNWKQRIYAAAGVASYWIVNLVDDCVEVFAQPDESAAAPAYGQTAQYRAGDQIPVLIDGQEIGRIAASAILGSR